MREIDGWLTVVTWNVNKADVNSTPEDLMAETPASSEGLLFLTDEQLRKGIEAMFFAYRGFTADQIGRASCRERV